MPDVNPEARDVTALNVLKGAYGETLTYDHVTELADAIAAAYAPRIAALECLRVRVDRMTDVFDEHDPFHSDEYPMGSVNQRAYEEVLEALEALAALDDLEAKRAEQSTG